MPVTLTMLAILLVWGAGTGYLRIRYARRYGGDAPGRALAWSYLGGGPKEGRRLQVLIYVWGLGWPALLIVLGLTVFQSR
jgi:hypothetical protein